MAMEEYVRAFGGVEHTVSSAYVDQRICFDVFDRRGSSNILLPFWILVQFDIEVFAYRSSGLHAMLDMYFELLASIHRFGELIKQPPH